MGILDVIRGLKEDKAALAKAKKSGSLKKELTRAKKSGTWKQKAAAFAIERVVYHKRKTTSRKRTYKKTKKISLIKHKGKRR